MDALRPALRDATAADRAWLLEAVAALNDHERALHDTRLPGAAMAAAYLATIERATVDQDGSIVLAVADDGPVGFIACRVERGDTPAETADSNVFGYVSDAYVAPAARGRGVAGLLLAEAERRLRALGVTRLRLGSLAANTAAIRAYRKAGFADYEVVLEKRVGGG
ncbi:MAG: GNAT family N-acetyltransferase [Rhodospirillales bacterium]|nr:MAG: GNAT family N-acetyltransferase [Rhodospirillales bacterium]